MCNKKRHNSLLHAVSTGTLKTVSVLIKHGANLDPLDGEGKTPLMWASLTGKGEVVNYLLQKGAEATIQDQAGQTAKG